MYQAIITRLKNVRKHPNADRLNIADCYGYQVIVSSESKEGDLGVYFPTDGRLSLEFCEANDLIARVNPETGEREGGLFDDRRKVSTLKLRKERSEGFWCPISYIHNLVDFLNQPNNGVYLRPMYEEGQLLTHVHDHLLCERYETAQTKKAAKQNQGATKPKSIWFPEHVDTAQFLIELANIPVGSVIYVSEKLHGTSQRFGKVFNNYQLSWWKKLINKIWKNKYPETGYEFLVGTRRTILDDSKPSDWYNDRQFRFNVCCDETLLKPGQIVYGEVVGYTTSGAPIMQSQPTSKTQDKAVIKQYGNEMRYSYGCDPVDTSKPEQDFYAYRIQFISPEVENKELNYDEFETECTRLGLKPVPLLTSFEYDGDQEKLKQLIIDLANGPSAIDSSHIKEGVVLRIEIPKGNHAHDGKIYHLKYKSYLFRELESRAKDNESFKDLEEAS